MRLLLLASLCACHPDSPEASVHGLTQTAGGADPVPPSLASDWRGERPHGPLGEDRGSSAVPEIEPAPDGGDEGVYSVKDTGTEPSGGLVFTEFTDVVVVGSGPAGISAAIAAESSGAHVIVTLIGALKQQGKKRGVASLCIGGGERACCLGWRRAGSARRA